MRFCFINCYLSLPPQDFIISSCTLLLLLHFALVSVLPCLPLYSSSFCPTLQHREVGSPSTSHFQTEHRHTHTPAATSLHGGGQDRSSSKMTTHLQLSPCLQKSPTVFSSPLGGPARAGVGPHDLPACLQTDWQLPALPQKLS